MSEFGDTNFYGFSIRNDPNLKTTTENFKFRYTQPEFIQKAIQKVHNKEDPNNNRNHMMWYNYCRLRETSTKPKEHLCVHTNETDVETQIKTVGPSDTEIVRDLTDREVDNLIGIAKHDASQKKKSTMFCCCSHEEDMSTATVGNVHICKRTPRNKSQFRESQYKEESCLQTKDIDQINLPLTNVKTLKVFDCVEQEPNLRQIDYVVLEEYRRPQPKWVEIVEPNKDSRLEIEIKDFYLKSSKPLSPRTRFPDAYGYENVKKANFQMSHCLPAVLMTEVITDNVQRADKYMNTTQYGNLNTFTVEDSDLELKELSNRQHFTKYIKASSNEMLNLSFDDDTDRIAELIGIKSDVLHVNEQQYLRSSSTDLTDFHNDILNKQCEQNNQMKIFINDLKKKQNPNKHRTFSDSTKTPETCASPQKEQQQVKRKTKQTLRQQHLQRVFESSLAGHNGTTNHNSPHDHSIRSSTPEQPQRKKTSRTRSKCVPSDKESHSNTGHRSLRHNNLLISKSIEDLKTEKTCIFKKMTTSQEKMIEVLDKLRLSLLELHVPENSYEKSRRQKNAFEFSVRFSRNFLYPLKGMKENLKLTAAEQFNSLTSNEACNRVCHMYNLLLQSLNTYQKQLRFFLLDHVPQKLTSLIEMIHSSTEICLEKDIFSKQDVVVDCLQLRCLKFLGFLEDFQEGRLQMDSKSYRKLTQEKALTKYDLKMFMNDLNMYEPKLVPKVIVPDRSAKSKKNKTKKPSNQVIVYDFPDMLLEKPPEDTIPTHVQGISDNKSCSCLVSSQLELASGDGLALDKNVIKALQEVTKEQVRQVLKPILDSLGSALGNQNNSEAIEAILNAFNVKVITTSDTENQQNFDDKYEKEGKIKTIELSSVDCVANTCKSLKAAKHTKTLRQQNSHEALSKKRSSTTSTTGVTVDDDNIDNGHNNNNSNKHDSNNKANSKSNSNISTSKRNSTTHLRGAFDGGGDDFCGCGGGGGGVVGEYSNKAYHMGEQMSMTTKTSNERVSQKIMNEDQSNRAGSQSEDIQITGYQRKDDIQTDIYTSDTDDEHNPHRKATSKIFLKSHDACPFTQQTTNSQCQLHSIARNSSKLILHHVDSYQCLNTIKTKSRSKKKKRNTLSKPTTPANAVTPSSSRNRIDNKDNSTTSIQSQRTRGDEQEILAANPTKTIMPGRASSNERDDSEIQFEEHKANLACGTDLKLATSNMIPSALCANYVELHNKSFLPQYFIHSPINKSEENLCIKSAESKLKEQESINTIKPISPLKPLMETSLPVANPYDQRLIVETTGEPTYQKDRNENSNVNDESKPDLQINEMVKERDRFLELCSKNRFYRNPNYAEPWKVFSSISESLLNDVLNCVETDFATGVTKFVEDFLQLETKT